MKKVVVVVILFLLILSGCSSGNAFIKLGEFKNASSNHTVFNYTYNQYGDNDYVMVTVQNITPMRVKLLWHTLSLYDERGNQVSGIEVEHTTTIVALDDGEIGFILYKWRHTDEVSGVNVSLKTQKTSQPTITYLSGTYSFSTEGIRIAVINNENYTQNFLRVYIILYNREGAFNIDHYDVHNLLSGERREILIPMSSIDTLGE